MNKFRVAVGDNHFDRGAGPAKSAKKDSRFTPHRGKPDKLLRPKAPVGVTERKTTKPLLPYLTRKFTLH